MRPLSLIIMERRRLLPIVSLLLTACVLCYSSLPFKETSIYPSHEDSRRILRVQPTWELEKRSLPETESSPLRFSEERRILLRIHYGRKLQEGVSIEEEETLTVSVAFEDIYQTIIFIAVAWVLGIISVQLGMPSLVGEIVAGFLLGPPLADFVPFPQALALIGKLGLIGLILESGIGIDVAQLKEVGKRAILLAITGSALPLLCGFGLGQWKGLGTRSAIAIGAAFSPSSLGVAANGLSAGEVLNTPIGQMIVASSVVDDVLGLILLSILEVFVDPNPKPFDFVLPFIASFGYLIVLGYSGITWMPRLIENRVMPLVAEEKRDFLAFALMFALLIGYMPLLNYSGASYLTGVFLAGLTFSQIHSIHVSFVNNGRPLLNWLLRIFFAATIGFQVPIKKFEDLYVLKWGAILLIPVVAKMPLGAFVPHSQRKLPDDFPYNPYYRDVLITSLAMTCRGEFNFIIAAFALGEGLFDARAYSATVFAILVASIVSPLALVRVIRYYNEKSKNYLDGTHPIKRIANTCDGYRPVFLAIQARTPVHWGLQETFKKALEEAGLIIIDHRTWHTLSHDSVDINELFSHELGHDAVLITELFAQDTKVRVRVPACFSPETTLRSVDIMDGDLAKDMEDTDLEPDSKEITRESSGEDGISEDDEIQARCDEIREVLVRCLESDNPEDYMIQVSQWEAYVFDDSSTPDGPRSRCYTFHSTQDTKGEDPPTSTSSLERGVSQRRRFDSVTSVEEEPHLVGCDLWETDRTCHDATREGYVMSPDVAGHGGHNITGGYEGEQHEGRGGHNRRASFDASLLSTHAQEALVIKERLHGYVRPTPHL